MSYEKQIWEDLPSENTPVNAERMNHIEEGIDSKLDKMTEGTWEPILNTLEGSRPTVELTSRRGTYKRIGNLVYIDFYIRGKITALNGTDNYACITGLPFNNKQVTQGELPITLGILYGSVSDTNNNNFTIHTNNIRINCNYGTSATSWKITTTNYMAIGGAGWYEIDD